MMTNQKKLRLENLESIDNNMSLEKIIQAHTLQEPITGVVDFWDSKKKQFTIDLGNGIMGFLPVCNSSVYPLFVNDEILSPSLRILIGKPVVLNVKSIDISNKEPLITLSRKELMIEAFEQLSNMIGETIECCIKSFSSFGVFVDVGNGISGLIHYKDLSLPRIYNFSEIGLKIGDKITAKITSADKAKYHIGLNYKDQFENLAFTLNKNDLVQAVILDPLNENGFFAFLNVNTPAVVDFPPTTTVVKYGDKIIAKVKGTRKGHPEDLKLAFVSFIE